MVRAAFSSRSSTNPQRGQTCVRTRGAFWTRYGHGKPSGRTPEQSWVVYAGGAANTRRPAHIALPWFALVDGPKCRPPRVANALGKMRVADHVGHPHG